MDWFIYAILSAVFYSATTLANKKALAHEHANQFSTLRAFFIVIFCMFFIPQMNFGIPWQGYFLIYFVSIIISAAMMNYLKALRHMDVSFVSPLMNFSPFFLLIISFAILGETPALIQILGIAFIVLGTYILEVDHSAHQLVKPFQEFIKSKYIHFLIFAMVAYSFVALLDKIIVTTYANPFTYVFLVWIGCLFNFSLITFSKFGFSDVVDGVKKGGPWIMISAVFTILNIIMFYKAISLYLVSLVMPIRRMSSLMTTIVGGELFHEDGLKLKIIACCVMLIGAILIVW